MTEAENVMERAGAKEHKGNYGNVSGKSVNALYKSYKTWAEDKNKVPMDFKPWMKWANEKGLIKGNYSADAVSNADEKKDEAVLPVKSSMKKYVSVVIVVVFAVVLYKAYKSEQAK